MITKPTKKKWTTQICREQEKGASEKEIGEGEIAAADWPRRIAPEMRCWFSWKMASPEVRDSSALGLVAELLGTKFVFQLGRIWCLALMLVWIPRFQVCIQRL